MDKNKVLAKILLEMPENEPGQVLGEIKLVQNMMESGLADLMKNPVITNKKKKSIFEKLLKDYLSDDVLKFINFLICEDLIKNLGKIIAKYKKLMIKQAKTVKVEMTTAVEWSPEKLDGIKNTLREKFKSEPIISNRVDKNVLAGVAIRIGDKVYDNTLNKKIEEMYRGMAGV